VRIIIEFDGPIIDVGPVHYQIYREVAAEVGWSRLDQATYWSMIRTRGRDAVVLPGAKPVKLAAFWNRFDRRVEEDDVIARYEPHPEVKEALETIVRHGRCCLITIGPNLAARERLLDRMHLGDALTQMERLDADPRRRPGELRTLGASDRRVLVIAGSDTVARSAGQAELLPVGISSGPCTAARLRRARADIVYSGLHQLAESLRSGAKDLIQAGLLPPPL
jgi:phosphoglycolate phosphatase-like HAD superfamily hydrolase